MENLGFSPLSLVGAGAALIEMKRGDLMEERKPYGITAAQIREKYDSIMAFSPGPQRDLVLLATVGDLILWIEDAEKRSQSSVESSALEDDAQAGLPDLR